MRTLLSILLLLSLTGCGGSDDAAPCENSKEIFSLWRSDADGTQYQMSAGAFDAILEIKFGPGACDDGRGDFTMIVGSDNTVEFSNCAAAVLTDAGTYSKECNVLTINYDSGGAETFR